MTSQSASLIITLALLQCTPTSASITGKLLKYTTFVAAPFVLKHTLLSKEPTQDFKELWSKCTEDGHLVRKNTPLYLKLAKHRAESIRNKFESIQGKQLGTKGMVARAKEFLTPSDSTADPTENDSSSKDKK